jgi:hypothetical protein
MWHKFIDKDTGLCLFVRAPDSPNDILARSQAYKDIMDYDDGANWCIVTPTAEEIQRMERERN